MRRALVVGINHYDHAPQLYGCVDDAREVKDVVAQHGDGTANFGVRLMTGNSSSDPVLRSVLKDEIEKLFDTDCEIALLYFAGHGSLESTGGYLMASDSRRADEGLALNDLLLFANRSRARNKILLLDSCHSGIAGSSQFSAQAELSEGVTILTASTAQQYAREGTDGGVFTTLLVDALHGAAANLLGDITPGSVYAHIDQSLGPWDQRPVFKTNVKNFVSLRRVHPPISADDLRRISEFFPQPGYQYPLDPTYEPELTGRSPGMPDPIPDNVARFAVLQRFNRVNLVVPVGVSHMWHAAMGSRSCELTALGKHYRRLVSRKLI